MVISAIFGLPAWGERAMWSDNEAKVDLLGFEFLVDGLFVALTQPQLLPSGAAGAPGL